MDMPRSPLFFFLSLFILFSSSFCFCVSLSLSLTPPSHACMGLWKDLAGKLLHGSLKRGRSHDNMAYPTFKGRSRRCKCSLHCEVAGAEGGNQSRGTKHSPEADLLTPRSGPLLRFLCPKEAKREAFASRYFGKRAQGHKSPGGGGGGKGPFAQGNK